jgi:hypothetical protein
MTFLTMLLACSSNGPLEGWTDGEHFYVVAEPTPDPIPFNEYFSVSVSVLDGPDGTLLNDSLDVLVDANMPAHNHGMNEAPTMSLSDEGYFQADGLKWFMTGEWELEIYITDTNGLTEQANFLYECCE